MFGEALLKRGTAVFDELRQSVEERFSPILKRASCA
ncbi:hypothetical protein ABIF68_000861 [Bradyrhizobium japonicum]|jgi:hypothetical protein